MIGKKEIKEKKVKEIVIPCAIFLKMFVNHYIKFL